MNEIPKFRHEELAAVPKGKVRTVTHPSGHQVRIAFPPGPRCPGSGQLVSLLHPLTGPNPCPNLGPENPCEFKFSNPTEQIKDSKGRKWFVTTISSGKDWMAEGYPVEGKRLKRVGRPLIARGATEAEAGDKLAEMMDSRNPVEKSKVESRKLKNRAAEGWRSVAGEKVDRSQFAYVGDPELNETWKLPVHDAAHIRNAMARFGRTRLPKDARHAVAERIVREAKKYGIDSSGFEARWFGKKNPKLDEIEKGRRIHEAMQKVMKEEDAIGWEPIEGRGVRIIRRDKTTRDINHDELRALAGLQPSQKNPLDEAALGRIVAAAKRRGILNPNGDIEKGTELYRKFHGKDPKEVIEQQEADTIRGTYVALGDRPVLVFRSPGGGKIELDFSGDGAKLAANAEGTQLYLIGGDQQLADAGLEEFGSDASKDFVDLGEALTVTYDARKRHNNFQLASWKHKFGEEGGARPWGFYDKLRKRIFLVGGSYKVEAPGIEN